MSIPIREFAARAGVSTATISLAMNGDPRVRKSTRDRIVRMAKEIGYRPSAAARALKTGIRENVGLALAATTRVRTYRLFKAYAELIHLIDTAQCEGVDELGLVRPHWDYLLPHAGPKRAINFTTASSPFYSQLTGYYEAEGQSWLEQVTGELSESTESHQDQGAAT